MRPGMAGLCLTLLVTALCTVVVRAGDFTNDFAVEVDGDVDVADLVAATHGFKLVKQVSGLGNVFHFTHERTERRSKRRATDIVQTLSTDPNVKRVEQQIVLRRDKREIHHTKHTKDQRHIVHDKQLELPIQYQPDKSVYEQYLPTGSKDREGSRDGKSEIPQSDWTNEMGYNDPFFPLQWYYDNRGQTHGTVGMDVDILPVWKKGLTGKGVVVTILDDGIDHTHPDLTDNYDPDASTDLNDLNDNDPLPDYSSLDNSHGTRCAGEIAAKANNNICGVGIAHNARIGGVRMLDGVVTDLVEAEAVSFNRDYIDIYSASWGPNDNGATMEAPGHYCRKALEDGVRLGRGGKGSIYVWATGNGGMVGDDCSCDGYVSSIETLSIGSINDHGLSTFFSESCPSTMAVTFTGGAHYQPGQRGYSDPPIKVVTTDLFGNCTLEFQGTSAAAPMAAGCFALVLEANGNLTWRDLQYLVVHTARIPNSAESGWTINGGGHHVNHQFGFGVLDCGRLVEEAQHWTNVPPQRRCDRRQHAQDRDIRVDSPLTDIITVDSCVDTDSHITRLEHVQVHIQLSHRRRGDLTIVLASPDGTHSTLLSPREHDDDETGINFTFMTVHNWGENPTGDWVLTVTDIPQYGMSRHSRGVLHSWGLTLWGVGSESGDDDEGHQAPKSEVSDVMNEEMREADEVDIEFHKEKRVEEQELLKRLINMVEGDIDKSEREIGLTVAKKSSLGNENVGTKERTIKKTRFDEVDREIEDLAGDLVDIIKELEDD